jgi:hypothetical protein
MAEPIQRLWIQSGQRVSELNPADVADLAGVAADVDEGILSHL